VTAKLAALTAGLVMLLLAPAGAKAKTFTPIPAQQFKLVKHGFGKATKRRISQLAQAYPRVGLNALLGDTNRVNTPLMPGLRPNGAFGYSWESGDNSVIANGVSRYPNAVLVDWHNTGDAHPEFFYDDEIHLRPDGADSYAQLIAPDAQ
jgi:hypothetical protein